MNNNISVEQQALRLCPDPHKSLEDLAKIANEEHTQCIIAGRTTLQHAIACGEALTKAREQIEYGEWQKWLADNFNGNIETARKYVRFAAFKQHFDADMTITAAEQTITGLPDASPRGRQSLYSDDVKQTAIELVRNGTPVARAARHVGASPGTVDYWVDPDKHKKRVSEASKVRREQAKEAAEILAQKKRQADIKLAVRKAGAALSEAYSMAERMGGVLSQALSEATDDEAKEALVEAMRLNNLMRDEVVRALGVS